MKDLKISRISLAVGLLLAASFALSFWVYWHRSKKINEMVIADDVANLVEIFNGIHKDCGIIDFETQKNDIDFLNVISFEGSEVDPMNLKHPEKWKGAYLKDNPTIQERYYQVVQTRKGYYIVPGPGVVLSNGKVIGKNIMFNTDTDIDLLIKTDLQFKGRALAARIMTSSDEQKNLNSFNDDMARDRLRGM